VIQEIAGAVVLVVSALVLALRLRAATALQRRVLGLLYGYQHIRPGNPRGVQQRLAARRRRSRRRAAQRHRSQPRRDQSLRLAQLSQWRCETLAFAAER
jgi:hypothetical protein